MSETSKVSETGHLSETTNESQTDRSSTPNLSDSNEISQSLAELKALVAELSGRLQKLEDQAAQWHPEVSEEVLLAISAACAAYLGERATIKQVHLRRGGTWASQGRAAAQQLHADLHGYGDRQSAPTTQGRRGMR